MTDDDRIAALEKECARFRAENETVRNGGKPRKIAAIGSILAQTQVTEVPKISSKNNAHRLCAAPMMDWTDFIGKTAAKVHRGTP